LIRLYHLQPWFLQAIVTGCPSNDLPFNAVTANGVSNAVEIIGGLIISTNPDGVIREVTMTLMRVRLGSCMTAIKKEITHNGETLKVISNVNKVMTVDYSSDFTRTYRFFQEKDITPVKLIENETDSAESGNYYTFK
jgi:hypothetical protein